MDNATLIRETIGKMTDEEFTTFVNEVHYAAVYHHLAGGFASKAVQLDSGENSALTGAIRGMTYHPQRQKEILSSALYQAIREEIGRRIQKVPEDWKGWIGLEREDEDAIVEAIRALLREKYPILEMLRFQPVPVEKAQTTLEQYGIHQIFIGEEDLAQTFIGRYCA